MQRLSQGIKTNPGNFANNPKRAQAAGRIGGMAQGKHSNPGNFAHDPVRASLAGVKGGTSSRRV